MLPDIKSNLRTAPSNPAAAAMPAWYFFVIGHARYCSLTRPLNNLVASFGLAADPERHRQQQTVASTALTAASLASLAYRCHRPAVSRSSFLSDGKGASPWGIDVLFSFAGGEGRDKGGGWDEYMRTACWPFEIACGLLLTT